MLVRDLEEALHLLPSDSELELRRAADGDLQLCDGLVVVARFSRVLDGARYEAGLSGL